MKPIGMGNLGPEEVGFHWRQLCGLLYIHVSSVAFCLGFLVFWPMRVVNMFVYLVKLGICYISIECFGNQCKHIAHAQRNGEMGRDINIMYFLKSSSTVQVSFLWEALLKLLKSWTLE